MHACVFVCQDLLEPDWDVRPAPAAADVKASAWSCALRGSSASHREPEKSCPQQTGGGSASLCNGTERNSLHSSAPGFRQLPSTRPAPQNNSLSNVASPLSRRRGAAEPPELRGAEDDFDDWDVDLADLDECPIWQPLRSAAPPAPAALARTLRPPSHGGVRLQPNQSVSELSPARQPQASSANQLPPQTLSTPLRSPYSRPAVHSAPLLSPNLCPGPSPIPRPPQQHRPCTTPRPFPPPHGLYGNPSPSRASTMVSPHHPLHTPVLTNRLVQLVSASSKLPCKRPRSGCDQPRTRRFPGPAGLLPEQVSAPPRLFPSSSSLWTVLSLRCCSSNESPPRRAAFAVQRYNHQILLSQPQGQNLEKIVVSAPLTPAHGAVARLQSQVGTTSGR